MRRDAQSKMHKPPNFIVKNQVDCIVEGTRKKGDFTSVFASSPLSLAPCRISFCNLRYLFFYSLRCVHDPVIPINTIHDPVDQSTSRSLKDDSAGGIAYEREIDEQQRPSLALGDAFIKIPKEAADHGRETARGSATGRFRGAVVRPKPPWASTYAETCDGCQITGIAAAPSSYTRARPGRVQAFRETAADSRFASVRPALLDAKQYLQ